MKIKSNSNYFLLLSMMLLFGMIMPNIINYRNDFENDESLWSTISTYNPSVSTEEGGLSTEKEISVATGSLKIAGSPSIAVTYTGDIHIVWEDNIDGNDDILYRNFTYSTQTWGEIINITNDDTSSYSQPGIAVDDYDNIWIVWLNSSNNNSIEGRYYDSNIKNWNSIENIELCDGTNQINDLKIKSSIGRNFTIVYAQNEGIYSKIKTKNYETQPTPNWESSSETSSLNFIDRKPDIFFDEEGNGHLTFTREINGITSIIYCNWTWNPLGGENFDGDYVFGHEDNYINVTSKLSPDDTDSANNPSIIASTDNNKIYISWEDEYDISSNSHIRLATINIADYVANTLLDDEILNITSGSNQNIFSSLSYCYNNSNPSLVWSQGDGAANGNIILLESLDDAESYLNDDYGDEPILNTGDRMLDVVSDIDNSIHVVYTKKAGFNNYRVYYRKFDVQNPQLIINSPVNNTEWNGNTQGNISLTISTERDTRLVKYEYYLDENGNGLTDDGNTWITIAEIENDENNFNWEWNTTKIGDVKYGLLKVNATDINNLSDIKYVENILVDNKKPQITEIVKISDNQGNLVENSIGEDIFVTDIINITINVEDNCSGIDYVEFFNGTAETPFISQQISTSEENITLDTTSGAYDGNYTNVKLIAYDNLGNSNVSELFNRNFIIDNYAPTPAFITPSIGDDVTDSIYINVTSNEDNENIDSVNFFYYKTEDGISTNQTIGAAALDPNKDIWYFAWELDPLQSDDGNYTIIAVITDKVGYSSTIDIEINVDYTSPTVQIISPEEYEKVGSIVDVIVVTDLDVEFCELWNCSTKDGTYTKWQTRYADNYSYINGSTRVFELQYYSLDLTPGETHFLKVNASDTRFSSISSAITIIASENKPGVVTDVSGAQLYIESNKTYNITLEWNSPGGGFNANITHYYIYKIQDDERIFDSFLINQMNETARKEYLGAYEGDKYLIKKLEVEQLYDSDIYAYNWTETGLYAGDYYYLIFAVNILDHYSNCSAIVEVKIEPEIPSTQPNMIEVKMMPYIFAATLGFITLISMISVSSARRRRHQRQTKETLEDMYEEKFTETGEKSLEERLDQMESLVETSIKEDAGTISVRTSNQLKEEEVSFVDMKISSSIDDKKTPEELSGPRRCPHCNWMVSSTATKCPRCGKMI